MRSLERSFPNAFLDLAQECGYTTQSTKKISAEFWTAMVEAAGLRVNQSRIINEYLTDHFGKRVCIPEHVISSLTSRFLEFKTEKNEIDGKQVLYSWKDLCEVLQFYEDILVHDTEQIEKMEISLGGDHGKGKFSFVALVIVRYKKEYNRESKIL